MNNDAPRPGRIFICYRREDKPTFATLVHTCCVNHYGEGNVFIDKKQIPAGAEFNPKIEQEIGRSDVIIVLIGKQWVKLIQKRAIEEFDPVRMEIALALKLKKFVVPVCFGGEEVPKASEVHYQVRPMLLSHNSGILRDTEGDASEI